MAQGAAFLNVACQRRGVALAARAAVDRETQSPRRSPRTTQFRAVGGAAHYDDDDRSHERHAMTTTDQQLSLTRIVNVPRDEIEFDVRPGGHLRWTEVFPDDPGSWTKGSLDLTDVVDGELLEGVMRIAGELPGGFEPFETRVRVEFHDETEGRTRLEIRQWLPESYVAPSVAGWAEALSKLDAVLES